MNAMKRLIFTISFSLLVLIGPQFLEAQELKQFTTYAQKDYEAYKNSQEANPAWNDFVMEAFEAFDKSDMETAIEFLRKSVNLGCKSPLVLTKLALAYESIGSYYSAVHYYKMAELAFKKNNKKHRYRKKLNEHYGRALYMMGDLSRALPYLEKAARKNPNPWVLQLLGQHYLNTGDQLKASSYYEMLLQYKTNSINNSELLFIYLNLARLYAKEKQESSSIHYYKQVLEIDPENREALYFIREIERAKVEEKSLDVLKGIR